MTRTPLFLSLSAAALLLTACPPVEPPIAPHEGSALRAGGWAVDIYDVELAGRCGELHPRDLLEVDAMGMLLGNPGDRGQDMVRHGEVRLLLEGLPMDGFFDGFELEASAFLPVDGPTEPVEPRPDDGPPPDDEPRPGDEEETCVDGEPGGGDAPPPPCEVVVEEEPASGPAHEGPGMSAQLSARVYEPVWFEGRLDLHYDTGALDCRVSTWIEARHVGDDRGPGDEPHVMVEDEDVGEAVPGEGEDRDEDGGEGHGDEDRGDEDRG